MKLNITGHETALTPELKKYITNKMNKLCKKYKQILEIDILVEVGAKKTTKKLATVKGKISVAGPDLNAEATEKTAFAAADELERKLVRLLERDKDLHNPKITAVARGKQILHKILRKESKY
jgi:ribosomal subunit interface protein